MRRQAVMSFLSGVLFGLTLYVFRSRMHRWQVAPTILNQRHDADNGSNASAVQVEQALPTVTQAQDNRARLAGTTRNGTTPPDHARIQPDEISLDGTYWVYENWRAQGHKAVVHRATCRHCNNGRGQNGGTDPSNGRWHGPFASAALAEAKAQMTGGYTRSCGFCRPT